MAENFTLPCTTKVLQCISVHSSSSEQDSLCRLVGVCSLMYILPGLRSPPPSCRDWPTHRLTQKRHQKLRSQIASHTSFETSRGDRSYRQASTQAPPLPHSRKRRSAAHSSPFQMQMLRLLGPPGTWCLAHQIELPGLEPARRRHKVQDMPSPPAALLVDTLETPCQAGAKADGQRHEAGHQASPMFSSNLASHLTISFWILPCALASEAHFSGLRTSSGRITSRMRS